VRHVASRIEQAKHVRGVDVNPTTGSLLLRFSADDPIDMIVDELRLLGFEVSAAFEREHGPVRTKSHGAKVVEHVMGRANARLHVATHGGVDLRFVVPALYMALGIRNLLRQRGRLRDASWYQLMYWAFDSFFKLHDEATVGGGTPGRGPVSR
jgi:hypothetical protein